MRTLLGRVGQYGAGCHVIRVTENMDLKSYRTRRDLLDVASKRRLPIITRVGQPSLRWRLNMDVSHFDHTPEEQVRCATAPAWRQQLSVALVERQSAQGREEADHRQSMGHLPAACVAGRCS